MTNNGSGGFVLATNLPANGPNWVVAADVNRDGKADLINTIGSPYALSVFFNTSTFSTLPFTYTTNNGAITITGYTGANPAVVIPNTINGLPVTVLGANVFVFTSLTSVTSVTIPNSVTSISEDAFAGCPALTAINVSTNNPVYSSLAGVLFDKSRDTLIQYPVGLAGSYTIPSSVTSIGYEAFYFCDLTNVTIPNSVTNIGVEAFAGGLGLTSVTIPNSVTSIGGGAFEDCPALTQIFFQGNAPTPTNDISVFYYDGATAYYLQGTMGWGATFDGIPTSVILPPAPALGMSTYGGQPAVFFPTATGTNYVLQMTTNLSTGPWVTVTNGVPISGIIVTNNPPGAAFFRLH